MSYVGDWYYSTNPSSALNTGYFDPMEFYNQEDEEVERWRVEENMFTTDKLSRYILQDRIRYRDGYQIQECMDRVSVPITDKDSYYIVPLPEENRLDLISFRHYGTVVYWWVIAAASRLYNPLIVPARTKLVIPSSSTVVMYRELVKKGG